MSFQLIDNLPPPIQKKYDYRIEFESISLVELVLGNFPIGVWSNKNLRWLVSVGKNGVFEYAIYCRLMRGLEHVILDKSERREWIMKHMITSFCSARTEKLIKRHFLAKVWDDMDGWENRSSEVYVADFLSTRIDGDIEVVMANGSKKKFVKFDCIVGNPPYQLTVADGKTSSSALYPAFVEKAIECKPKYLSMVIPSKWMSGDGKGTEKFLNDMTSCNKIASMITVEDAKEWFPDILLKGGAMFFLYDHSKNDSNTLINGVSYDLVSGDSIITDEIAVAIKTKALAKSKSTIDQVMFGQTPYGIMTNHNEWTNDKDASYACHCSGGSGKGDVINHIAKKLVSKNVDSIPRWKVCIANASGKGKDGTGDVFIVKPNAIITQSYMVISHFGSKVEAENFASYLSTKPVQAVISVRKGTHHMPKRVFSWVPVPTPLDLGTMLKSMLGGEYQKTKSSIVKTSSKTSQCFAK